MIINDSNHSASMIQFIKLGKHVILRQFINLYFITICPYLWYSHKIRFPFKLFKNKSNFSSHWIFWCIIYCFYIMSLKTFNLSRITDNIIIYITPQISPLIVYHLHNTFGWRHVNVSCLVKKLKTFICLHLLSAVT